MSADLTLADDRLRRLWPEIHAAYVQDHPGHDALLTCTYRSPAEQALLYAKGRSAPGAIVTNCDGLTVVSKHNHFLSLALDFCILIHGKVSWDPADYRWVGALAEARGLVWGGAWTRFPDAPHLELPEGGTT